MSSLRPVGTKRSLTFLSTMLMATAFTVPAFAQIETVVVTAERKAENIQTAPIAVTALTGNDLKTKQVTSARDLQFHTPSVTYTKTQFGGAQFQIRGITTAYGLGAAIANNENDIYLEAPPLVTGSYYDIDRVEIARGPQSTSYGRAATGGSVNIITSKPNLDEFQANASVDFGTFTTFMPEGMINIPIIDGELGVRIAFQGDWHNGYERNTYPGPEIYGPVASHINGLGTFSGRGSIRWEPNSDTTVDVFAEAGYENDSRVRGDKQLCHADPTGTLGCLPDQLSNQTANLNGNASNLAISREGITSLLNLYAPSTLPYIKAAAVGAEVGVFTVGGNGLFGGDPQCTPFGALACAGAYGAFDTPGFLGANLGLINAALTPLSDPNSVPAIANPTFAGVTTVPKDLLTTSTDFTPISKGGGATYGLNWQQKIFPWLSSTVDFGYTSGTLFTQQDWYTGPPQNNFNYFKSFQTRFTDILGAVIPADIATYDGAYFNVPGALPIANPHYNGTFGSYGELVDYAHGGIRTKTSYTTAFDEDAYGEFEHTGEVRFQTNFEGPLNFSVGAFYMDFANHNQYWVVLPGFDTAGIILGAATSAGSVLAGGPDLGPLVGSLPDFDGEYRNGDVLSRSAFLEGTYEILPDELKVIVGARYNDDRDRSFVSQCGACTLTLGFFEAGTPTSVVNAAYNAAFTKELPSQVPGFAGKNEFVTDLWTGRATVDWTPKLDFTDQTLVYFTASQGELAGGVNNINIATAAFAPPFYKASIVDALEFGTKNTLLDGTLQANLDVWYYNYQNYQITIIANRSSVDDTIPANLYGLESDFLWQPTEQLAFNATISLTHSAAGRAYLVDQRNPTGGATGAIANSVGGSVLVKDLVDGIDCVIVPTSASRIGETPGDDAAYHMNNFYLPNGGNPAADAPFGVPLVNYGVCSGGLVDPNTGLTVEQELQARGFDYAQQVNTSTGALIPGAETGSGIVSSRGVTGRSLQGNMLPNTPFGQVAVGAQYSFQLGGDQTLVPRLDYYWQSHMESRIWNDPVIDRVGSWDEMNLSLQYNGANNQWYVKIFSTNVFNKRNPTGAWVTDQAAALFTNEFSEDPRVVGFSVGTHW